MEAVSGYDFLFRRNGVYYFRRRVPEDVRKVVGRAEWVESLKTRDFTEAKRLRNKKAVQTDREVELARARRAGEASPPLSPEHARALADAWVRDRLLSDEAERLSGASHGYVAQIDFELEESGPVYREELALGDWTAVLDDVDRLLAAAGLVYSGADPSRKLMAFEFLKARVRLHDALADRNRGRIVESPVPVEVALQPRGVTVGHLIAAYRADKEAEFDSAWVDKRYAHVFRALEELLGKDKLVASITREDCRRVKQLLQKVPRHAGKRYPGLNLMEAVEAAERDGRERLSENTVSAYMTYLSAMLNWAKREGWLIGDNPAEGLGARGDKQVKRRAFTRAELEQLFHSLLPTRKAAPWKFWVPALAVYTGARANELCQLQVGDVVKIDDVHCIRISRYDAAGRVVPWKSVKTSDSERTVPLHKHLVEAGFLDVVARRNDRDARIFAELPEGPNGGFSHDLSKWFGAHLDSIGLSDPSLVFHSFRHGFTDACRRGGVSDATRRALGGWQRLDVAEGYGDRGEVGVLAKAVAALDFRGFSLAALTAEAEREAA